MQISGHENAAQRTMCKSLSGIAVLNQNRVLKNKKEINLGEFLLLFT